MLFKQIKYRNSLLILFLLLWGFKIDFLLGQNEEPVKITVENSVSNFQKYIFWSSSYLHFKF